MKLVPALLRVQQRRPRSVIPQKKDFCRPFGVFIDTIVICSCSAMIMLLAPSDLTQGLAGMDLLQAAMHYHMGSFEWYLSPLSCGYSAFLPLSASSFMPVRM